MIAALVYVLCTLTSTLCAILLFRSWRKERVGLLLWSTLCFVGLALNNVMLVIDRIVLPEVEMSVIRAAPAVIGLLLLVSALIREER